MAHCSKYMKRFKVALEYRKLPFPSEIVENLAKRATSDSQLDSIILGVLEVLEPPYCQKLHCPSHTTYGFCGCHKSLVPGKCTLNLKYIRDKKAKYKKIKDEIINEMTSAYGATSEIAESSFARMEKNCGGRDIKKYWSENKPKNKKK